MCIIFLRLSLFYYWYIIARYGYQTKKTKFNRRRFNCVFYILTNALCRKLCNIFKFIYSNNHIKNKSLIKSHARFLYYPQAIASFVHSVSTFDNVCLDNVEDDAFFFKLDSLQTIYLSETILKILEIIKFLLLRFQSKHLYYFDFDIRFF